MQTFLKQSNVPGPADPTAIMNDEDFEERQNLMAYNNSKSFETFSSSTISSARGALIYNSSTTAGSANRAVAILDFGADKTSTSGDFTIQFPAADASNAIIRIA